MSDYYQRSIDLHRRVGGKLATGLRVGLETRDDLSLAYTPGVAGVCQAIADDASLGNTLTIKGHTVAIVSDGSAVLGLGNIGPLAALPVMEGKAALFKAFADIDAFPLCLDTQDTEEIIETVRRIAPVFGGINLEDIAAPRCFEIEDRLQDLGIPVFHDDQHGTAIVLLAAMINASRVVGKELSEMKVVINGAGAAGTAIASLLRCVNADPSVCTPVKDIIVCDSRGALYRGREHMNPQKERLLNYTNVSQQAGDVHAVLEGADVFVGVSKGGLLSVSDVQAMAADPIIFAMANPEPEIMPDLAHAGGAKVVGTGRSDFANQVNNVLVFPGLFKGALAAQATRISMPMKLAAAHALADAVTDPQADRVLPDPLDKSVADHVAAAVTEVANA